MKRFESAEIAAETSASVRYSRATRSVVPVGFPSGSNVPSIVTDQASRRAETRVDAFGTSWAVAPVTVTAVLIGAEGRDPRAPTGAPREAAVRGGP